MLNMMGMGQAMPSVADIAAVTRGNGNNGWGNGFGEGWWVIVLLLAMFGGFGGGWGMGGYGMGYGGAAAYGAESVLQRSLDTQSILSKLDGVNNGICSLGYDQLAQMNNIGTQIGNVGTQVMQTGFGLTQAINQADVNNMQNTNALSRQLSDCCCENRAAIAQVRYDMATESCKTNNNIHQTGDAIIQSQNQGFQMLNNTIKDGFCNLEMREAQREIADLRQRLNDCDRNSALQSTAQYIVNAVRPTAGPAWIVDNPNACNNYSVYRNDGRCCNQNTCCG